MIAVDITLALDNALMMGIIAGRLPNELRRKAIFFGVCAAVVFRILFAILATRLLSIIGLTLAGGLLLLWVVWKIWQEAHHEKDKQEKFPVIAPTQLQKAIWQIVVADITMSLDNTLGVAGAARDHFWILVFGLTTSVALIGFASQLLAQYTQKHRWISYLGMAIVSYVALSMIWDGAHEVMRALP